MADNTNLNDLLIRIKNNDTLALSELYNLTKTDIFAFIFSIVKHYHDAEDIMHNVYVSIFKNSITYVSNNPKSWIFTIAKNECLMSLRKNKKEDYISNDELNSISQSNSNFTDDDKLLLEYLLNKLSDEDRKIIILHDVSGFKHNEISLLLGIPTNTIISKYNRSIKKLNSFIKEETK